MSAARPAASAAAVRRPAPAPAPAAAQQVAARPQSRTSFFDASARDDDRDELRLNLRDLPAFDKQSMEVEGFRPTLLSGLLDLFSPHKS